ncbi:MAG: glycosyltransferase family 4 protein, partial [Alphaproteobacteria bacterium]
MVETRYAHLWEYVPWRLYFERLPFGARVTVANSAWGFAVRRPQTKLVVIAHHCVFDPAFAEYKSLPQRIVHAAMVRPFERKSFLSADAVIAVSGYTADSVAAAFGIPRPRVILNGIETDFFTPGGESRTIRRKDPVKLLFVGNLTRRKGADILPEIMGRLGPGYELHYTSGLRTRDPFRDLPGMRPLGRLGREQLRDAYRGADLLLFPTRLEGFGYAAAEAMACGTPVVTSNSSSMPEVVEDGVTGRLCPVDDADAFAAAVRELS